MFKTCLYALAPQNWQCKEWEWTFNSRNAELMSSSDFFKTAFCSRFDRRRRREKFLGNSLRYGYPRIPACMLINSVMSPVFLVFSLFCLCPLLSCCFCSSRFTASFLLPPSILLFPSFLLRLWVLAIWHRLAWGGWPPLLQPSDCNNS